VHVRKSFLGNIFGLGKNLNLRIKKIVKKTFKQIYRIVISSIPQLSNRYEQVSIKSIIHFIHIGKTGGTAVKHALRQHTRGERYLMQLHFHDVELRDIPMGEKVIFFVRDPIKRFVSAFYDRQRKGLPRHYAPWSREEESAFREFGSANDLAKSLSSLDSEKKRKAQKAMDSIYHVNSSFWDWFDNESYFLSRLSDIFFIGFQETLDKDFGKLREKLHLSEDVKLPVDDMQSHKIPGHFDKFLEEEALLNLQVWYAKDYAFYNLCKKIQMQVNSIR